MTETMQQLSATLRERMAIIADDVSRRDAARHMERLQDVSERLEQLEQRLAGHVDPQLRHYLQRRSYSKALELLEAAQGGAIS